MGLISYVNTASKGSLTNNLTYGIIYQGFRTHTLDNNISRCVVFCHFL